jgi:hypothetical protein
VAGLGVRSFPAALAFALVLGERQGIVSEVRGLQIHGSPYVDVTVVYPDGLVESARLGAESIPGDLKEGEHVVVSRAVNMIVSIRRA